MSEGVDHPPPPPRKKDESNLHDVVNDVFHVLVQSLEDLKALVEEGELCIVELTQVIEKVNFLFDLKLLKFDEEIAGFSLKSRFSLFKVLADLHNIQN